MATTKDTKKTLQSKIEAIKKINDNPQSAVDSLSDKYLNNIPSTDTFIGKSLSSFNGKSSTKKENKNDIFSGIVDISSQFLGNSNSVPGNDKLYSKQRIVQHSSSAVGTTLSSAKDIFLSNMEKAFFVGDGICGSDSILSIDALDIAPKEFDFMNTLTIDPTSQTGQIVYEPPSPDKGKQKTNRELFNVFTPSSVYNFDSNNGNQLFTTNWNSSTQMYRFTGLTKGNSDVKVRDFLNDYYSSIEMPETKDVLKTAMLLTIQGDGENPLFQKGVNYINRLLKKLLTICGSPNAKTLKNQNPTDMFNETDENSEFYFNFDDVEGIDLEDEDARYRKVLRFRDCNNFEIPANPINIEGFVYLSKHKPIMQAINSTFNQIATDGSEQSGMNLIDFHSSLLSDFITKVPKALMMTVLSPKMFLPFVIVNKEFGGAPMDIKEFVKKFSKAIENTISDLFWLFIREFWKLIKIDLLAFIAQLVSKILKNKYKRYLTIISALIVLLTKLLTEDIDNCYAIFSTMLTTINDGMSAPLPVSVPSTLLLLSDKLPGYSQDRALLNVTERLSAAGVPTGPLYGESNDIVALSKSLIDGHTEEMDTNSYVKVTLQGGVIPVAPLGGAATIIPATINGVGKVM